MIELLLVHGPLPVLHMALEEKRQGWAKGSTMIYYCQGSTRLDRGPAGPGSGTDGSITADAKKLSRCY
jgi:hypothetical protein